MSEKGTKIRTFVCEVDLATDVPPPASTFTLHSSSATETHLDRVPDKPVTHNNWRDFFKNTNNSALSVDRGFGAWAFLAAAFTVEGIVWAFPFSYGIFLDAYLQDPHISSQKNAASLLPLAGMLSSGIIYCSALIVSLTAASHPHHRHKLMWIGAALCCGTLIGASYATKIWLLILLQGIMYAIGAALLYLPCISFMSEWFVARRGMANGIIFSGTAAGGLLVPLILPQLISKYGPSKTLRLLGIATGILLLLVLPFVKGRVPQTQVHTLLLASGTRSWMKHKSFWIFLAANTLQGFGFFVPIVYLPTFARALRITPFNSALVVGMSNAAGGVGGFFMGYLSDRFNPWILALANLLATSAATFILWGVCSHSLGGLLAFGILYGSIAGGWSSMWAGFVRPVAGTLVSSVSCQGLKNKLEGDNVGMSTMLYGYLLLSRGIGNIVSNPISTKLLVYSQTHSVASSPERTGFDVGDGRFKNIIIYVGTCFAAAASLVGLGLAINIFTGTRRGDDQDLESV
ncbi:MFS general substrate transporter [Mycena sanguinolenta]|uniref:MFS general substrate transporter n=1 Tax=Mycena sanguinolenta TaxID=230812 RepID=A0A8H7D4Y3_9AGAR|nr:MFS general substrate transporter [Mycena sanguinolenta]